MLKDTCDLCQLDLGLSEGNNRLTHSGLHILFDTRAPNASDSPCAFCLDTNPSRCKLYLRRSYGRMQFDYSNSTCPLKVEFKLGNAERSSAKNPSTNTPVNCPLDSCREVVWRYNLKAHLRVTHGLTSRMALHPHKELWEVSKREIQVMRRLWKAVKDKKGRRKLRKVSHLRISESFSSRAYLRYVIVLPFLTELTAEQARNEPILIL